MLTELIVRDLGVISAASVVLDGAMTALTGETGAGKTLVVEAIQLLLGGRADPVLVRTGAVEARVDGRFVVGEREVVLTRVLPRTGRSRAYVDGHPVPVQQLAAMGRRLVDLHGQHAHQSLLASKAQREALDAFGRVDLGPLRAARSALGDLTARLAALGGDARARAREIDLLRFQVGELDDAGVVDANEIASLEARENVLADSVAHREAGTVAADALSGDGGVRDRVAAAVAAVGSRPPFDAVAGRLRSVLAEVSDIASDVRSLTDAIEEDPQRLDQLRARNQLLRDLIRKYGPDLSAVIAFHGEAARSLAELNSYETRAAELELGIELAQGVLATQAAVVRRARLAAVAPLAERIEERLRELAMPKARVRIQVEAAEDGDVDDGGRVTYLLAANPGTEPLPLAKVASGGELARAMLATRLALLGLWEPQLVADPDDDDDLGLGHRPGTLIFDEVDAGIGGEAAVAVGRALAALGAERQVLVVTHLAQVAAFADAQVLVAKGTDDDVTVTTVARLDVDDRVDELARMLSGNRSATARNHARELLDASSRAPGPSACATRPEPIGIGTAHPSVTSGSGRPKRPTRKRPS